MKRILTSFAALLSLAACSPNPVAIGDINMISNRNVSQGAGYQLIQKFSNSSTEQLEESEARTITEAIDNVVKAVPGGEYLMNAKLYRVGKFYAAEGDVWGIAGQTDINGLKPNGSAYLKRRGGSETVQVLSFVDKNRVNVKLESGKIIIVDRKKLVVSAQ